MYIVCTLQQSIDRGFDLEMPIPDVNSGGLADYSWKVQRLLGAVQTAACSQLISLMSTVVYSLVHASKLLSMSEKCP